MAVPLPLGGRVGKDEAGGDEVGGDHERAEFVRHLPGEADLAGCRAGVGLDARLAYGQAGRRGDVDEPAPSALLRRWHDGARTQERSGQVRVDDRVPVVVAALLLRVTGLPARSAGVVDQDVRPAHCGEELPHGGRHGQVDGVFVDPVDLRSLAAERIGDLGSDAVGGSGDDRHPARQSSCHGAPSWVPGARPTEARGTRNIGSRTRTFAGGVPSTPLISASTPAAPSSASGMATLLTRPSRNARHSSSSKLTTETSPGTRAPPSRNPASTPTTWLLLPPP